MPAAVPLREVVYRLLLRDGARPPALPLGLVPGSRMRVETLATNLDGHGNVWRLVQVHGSPEEIRAAARAFSSPKGSLLEKRVLGRGRRLLVLWYKYRPRDEGRGPSLTGLAFQVLGPETVITDRSTPDGLEVRILTRQGRPLKRFLARLEPAASAHHDFRLLYVGPPRLMGQGLLGPEEERAIVAARDAGFFEVPRRGSLRQVASALGCSASTLSARLRRAESKLLRAYMGEP
jgi:hypothetical protein